VCVREKDNVQNLFKNFKNKKDLKLIFLLKQK
jgi:hypothetical protein